MPAVTNVASTASNGVYTSGSITITVTFDSAVSVTGTPQLSLSAGTTEIANYASGSGTNTLSFTYSISSGDFTTGLDYTSSSALALNGGTIVDSTYSIPADLTLPTPGAANSLEATVGARHQRHL